MEVVMVGPFGLRPRGTMGVRALPMAQALASRGHGVTILLPPWQNPEDAGEQWEAGGVRVENVPLPPRIPLLFHALIAVRLARRALALHPDVVHLFKPKAYSGLAHWLVSRLPRARRPRLVVDADDWEGPGGWNEIGGYTPAQRRFFAWQERWGLTHADAVTVASRTLESLVWALGVPPARVFYVPNGVSNEVPGSGPRPPVPGSQSPASSPPLTGSTERRFSGKDLVSGVSPAFGPPPAGSTETRFSGKDLVSGASSPHPPVILLYTRFFEFPISRVIEVLRSVREQVPQARLLVVGKGLFGEEEELLRLAAQCGLTVARHTSGTAHDTPRATHDVTYLGWVPPDRLPACFAQADVAMYPFDDTLVNRTKCAVKLLDLLAAGVPVVAEAAGQNREMIRHGETGWLVPPGDQASFVEAVLHMLREVQLREWIGRAAARDVRERFAWKHLVGTVEQAYGMAGL
jgi:glycosyltransferase involved in cell wall biosynthesis